MLLSHNWESLGQVEAKAKSFLMTAQNCGFEPRSKGNKRMDLVKMLLLLP